MALLPDRERLAFATTNAAAFYKTDTARRQGGYTSPVLDAQQIAKFGSFRWMGAQPSGTNLRFSFRSGIAAEPDATWSPWTAARARGARPRDRASPPASRTLLQVRLEARRGSAPTPSSPPPGLLPADNPRRAHSSTRWTRGRSRRFQLQPRRTSYEPAHPNREGISDSRGVGRSARCMRLSGRRATYHAMRQRTPKTTAQYTLSFRRETNGEAGRRQRERPAIAEQRERCEDPGNNGKHASGGSAPTALRRSPCDQGWCMSRASRHYLP